MKGAFILMLETNSKYIQVGAFCDACNQCYPVFRNIENGEIVYENDDTCDVYVMNEINGSDDMQEVATEAVVGFINNGYKNGLRGAIPYIDGKMLGIYRIGEDNYKFGIQPIADYFAGKIPELAPMDIDDLN